MGFATKDSIDFKNAQSISALEAEYMKFRSQATFGLFMERFPELKYHTTFTKGLKSTFFDLSKKLNGTANDPQKMKQKLYEKAKKVGFFSHILYFHTEFTLILYLVLMLGNLGITMEVVLLKLKPINYDFSVNFA